MALWLGWGLFGAVMANVFSSALALAFFSISAWLLFRKIPVSRHKPVVSAAFLRRRASFSSLLFAGQVISQIGLQIDRALVGILLGTSAVTYYTVPTKITDRIPGMMQIFSTTLYPLSSEAKATNKIDELRHLYHEMIRILLWLTAFIATLLIVLSKNFLALWIGPEMMANSWLVLALLAAGIIWRSAGSVAYQVSTGMGRADVNLIASIWTAICLTVPILFLTPKWGAPGAALGVFAGLLVSNVSYDLFAQRKLLGGKSLRESLVPYLRIVLAVTGTVVASSFLPDTLTGWPGLFVLAGLVSCIYMGFGLATGAIQNRDILFARTKAIGVIKRIGSPRFKGI
jgi:O-antigen/teichoic acid export membrane protein